MLSTQCKVRNETGAGFASGFSRLANQELQHQTRCHLPALLRWDTSLKLYFVNEDIAVAQSELSIFKPIYVSAGIHCNNQRRHVSIDFVPDFFQQIPSSFLSN
ncbi:MAG: hypothetical protein O9274_06175 [Limnobacter sp.]|uniref:hypothetical protein n=1 Tax=Limnobacter TaxID=131079 RepID=UPI00102DD59B|nr:hypothetical protein [Limnobacter sp.]MCZ8015266.1 hypothetical protein [Limnobacter sp.]